MIVIALSSARSVHEVALEIRTTNTEETDARQAVRMRRFYIAVITYAGCGALAQVCAWMGYLPRWLPPWWVAGAILVNGAFFLVLHRGWNLSLRDPSMAQIQLVVSMVAAMALVFFADRARGALLLLLPVPMLFGVFRLSFRQMAWVGALGVVGYAGVIALSMHSPPDHIPLGLDLLNLVSLATVMLYVCLMCGHISTVREELAVVVTSIRELAVRDPLTGLFNRRHLTETLAIEVARCERRLRSGIALCRWILTDSSRSTTATGTRSVTK